MDRRQPPGGNGVPNMTQDDIDDRPSREAQLVARAGDDNSPDRRSVDRLFERPSEVLQYDDRFRPRIEELMVELARGVQRVAVDDDVARAEGPEHRDWILHEVRH